MRCQAANFLNSLELGLYEKQAKEPSSSLRKIGQVKLQCGACSGI